MRGLIFEAVSDYAGACDGTLTFDRDMRGMFIKGEVEDDCYNFRVDLTDSDCKALIDWLESAKECQ